MSKNKQRRDELEISSIRDKIQLSLDNIGFIRDISEDPKIKILERHTNDRQKVSAPLKRANAQTRDARLKQVTIDQLSDFQTTIDKIWEIDLEDNNEDYPGLAMQQGSTPEKAILILQKRIDQDGNISNYHLSIILVELKKALHGRKPIQDRKDSKKDKDSTSTLQQIYKKFQCAMNRMYMLLSINNLSTRKPYQDKSIYVKFQGLIFYNRNDIKDSDIPSADNNRYDLNESNLYAILTNPTRSETLTVNTLLEERDKIKIKFIPNPKPDQDNMTIPLKNLLDR